MQMTQRGGLRHNLCDHRTRLAAAGSGQVVDGLVGASASVAGSARVALAAPAGDAVSLLQIGFLLQI